MAVVLSIQPGYDASYPWKQIGAAGTGAEAKAGLDYYLTPAEKGGEPPGLWTGRGLAALGLAAGGVIDRAAFETLYGEHVDPRTGERLGRAPQQFASEQVIYAELAAAEPHASPARLAELRSLARSRTRRAVPFWDMTMNVSKSVSVFYGSLLAEAEAARRDGRLDEARDWDRQAIKAWEAIWEAGQAMLEYLQDEAGYVRTGYHRGSKAESRAELGKWERARDWVIGGFRQHTSRAGDPHLHIHFLVLAKAVTERDAKWRKLDSKGLYGQKHAAAQIATAVLEAALTREFGLVWVPRADGMGREIKGVSQKAMAFWSSRRRTITAEAQKIAEQRFRERGRWPDARQMDRIMRDITRRTRPGKENAPLDVPELARGWENQASADDLVSLREAGRSVRAEARAAREHDQVVAVLAQEMAAEIERQYGAAPDEAEMRQLEGIARYVTGRGARSAPGDVANLIRAFDGQWQAGAERERRRERERQARAAGAAGEAQERERARAAAGEAQAQVYAVAYPVPGAQGLTEAEAAQMAAEAITALQAQRPSWTRADLIGAIGARLPEGAHADRDVYETLADMALYGAAGENVALLSAPEWPRVPASLRRDDGESVFRPHAAERYAAQAQLTLEERLQAQAQQPGAPRLHPNDAARLLGASRQRLEAQLRSGAAPSAAELNEVTGCGLQMDQAAAAYHVLTSPRRAEVMIGPAGTGKTRTATEMARIWADAGLGPVVALTTSSNARNVIAAEARANRVTLHAYNTAEWLGHSETGGREAREPVALEPGTLLILDEASMMSLPDLEAIMRRATHHGAKVAVTGDPLQLQAVESGGGMDMLARKLGHVQLSEASRFRHDWEREATLRLRQGDVTVLSEYRQRGRLHAGYAEDIIEDAARAYLHDHLGGRDTLLMTSTEAMAAELSRRIQGDLIHWGYVTTGRYVRLRDGNRAYTGDRIMARRNDKGTAVSRTRRGLANRDVLRIVNADLYGTGWVVQAERLTGRDAAGQEMWSAPFELATSYLEKHAHLAYAVTFHTAEGRTVDAGISVFTGEEDRQAVNVALTRGRDRNEAHVIAGWRIADPAPGSEPAAELARTERLDAERAGLNPDNLAHGRATAEEVLGKCLDNDGRALSATDTREAEWSDMDRLDVLGVQWDHLAREATQRRYETALRRTLPGTQADAVVGDEAATWLWRSLREAEAAGLDGPAVLQRAVASGDLSDADSVAKVIDWRIRQQTAGMPALAARPFAEQIEPTGDPDKDRYWRELAEAMDGRQHRLGEHAAEYSPTWAQALGPVPDDPIGRADWEHKAGLVERYREGWGYAHPHEPVGARPGQHSPAAGRDWQAAAEALGYHPGDLHEHTDGQLHAWRAAYTREMAWAPAYLGGQLASAHAEIRSADIATGRAHRNAKAATDPVARQRLADEAAVRGRWERDVREYAAQLTEAQAGYDAWERLTAPTRDRAIAADAELRRRHPDHHLEPLRAPGQHPDEPATEPATGTRKPASPAASRIAADAGTGRRPPSADTPDLARHNAAMAGIHQQVQHISAQLDKAVLQKAREASEKAAAIESLQYQPGDPDTAPAPAWKTELETRQREAVHHEPMPRIPPPSGIGETAIAGVSGPEAAE